MLVIEVMPAPESAHTAVPESEPADVILNGAALRRAQRMSDDSACPNSEVLSNLHISRGSEGGMHCVVGPPLIPPLYGAPAHVAMSHKPGLEALAHSLAPLSNMRAVRRPLPQWLWASPFPTWGDGA